MKIHLKYYLFLIVLIAFSGCGRSSENKLSLATRSSHISMDNGRIKAVFTKNDNGIEQDFYAKKGKKWIHVVSSFVPPRPFPEHGVKLFDSALDPRHRFLVSELLETILVDSKTNEEIVVELRGKSNGAVVSQKVKLSRDNDYFQFEVSAQLPDKPARLDYLLSTFTFNLEKYPAFIHTPGMKFDDEESKQYRFNLLPGKDQIIGDRAFHAPAVILQEEKLFVALVPDLSAINKYAVVSPDARRTIHIPFHKVFSVPIEEDKYTMPTGLDLNVRTGLTDKPVFSFGLMDNIIAHHIHYQRVNDTSMIRTLNDNNIKYCFDLFVGAEVPEYTGFQRISVHHWERFGHEVFQNRIHLSMPFEEYFRIIDSVTFNPIPFENIDVPLAGYVDMGSWLQWEMDGLPVGGYRSAIPWWNDVLHNSTFWNNAREASGFWFWGKRLDKPELIERARRIINLCLAAPQNEHGLFALLYNANSKQWGLQFSDPPHGHNRFFLRESQSYEVAGMSKTGAHMLKYYMDCEQDTRITNYLKPYADWLLSVIDEKGIVPSYVAIDMESSPILYESAHPAASLWFLAEFYNATMDKKYLDGAEQIAAYLERDIIPEAKWIDLEQYFSCGQKPFDFVRDVWQNQYSRGNLSVFWACEGFAALYRASNNIRHLKLGEQCVDYATFTQCCWEPHFVYTAFPFGGFAVDNTDNSTMLDARQAEMVGPFIWYGKALARQDLLERGVAAARSSVVLINHPSHKANNIYRHTNIYPFGLGPENIDHEGHPQSAMRTHPSWGEGSGVFTGLANAYRELGGAYFDVEKQISVGVNGLTIDDFSFDGRKKIIINIRSQLFDLPLHWEKSYETVVQVKGLEDKAYNLVVNGRTYEGLSRKQLEEFPVIVSTDGSVAPIGELNIYKIGMVVP